MKIERDWEGDPIPDFVRSPIDIAPERVNEGIRLGLADLDAIAEPRTRQAIFNRVVRHYRTQPRRCPAEGRGMYRFGDDMCFIGPLIDDAHYDTNMEGYRVRDLMKMFAMPAWFVEHLDFIRDIQSLHDAETNWPDRRMEMVLEMFAAERELRMPA
jgi:hypothetical protein